MAALRVVVSGTGFMGREVLAALVREPELQPVGVLEKFTTESELGLPGGEGAVPMSGEPDALLDSLKPDLVVDFTNAAWTPLVARAALPRGIRLVVGTTGQSDDFLRELETLCRQHGVGAFVAPNFAIGAIVMAQLARFASKYFDFAEIIESHQQGKIDAPSGTALMFAREMAAARGRPFEHTMPEKEPLAGGRGAVYEGIAIHSQRMPGFVAHHEIAFGGTGQTLRIRHDSTGRESFIPGVLLAVREVMNRRELVIGLDRLMGI